LSHLLVTPARMQCWNRRSKMCDAALGSNTTHPLQKHRCLNYLRQCLRLFLLEHKPELVHYGWQR
jgi:hypothetical protein